MNSERSRGHYETMRTTTMLVAAMMATSAIVRAQEEPSEGIDLEMRAPDFDADTVRNELSAELGTPIGKPSASPRARLIVEHPTDRFQIALLQKDRSIVRVVDLPKSPKSARETLVLLLASMTRDEAGPLLDELRKGKKPHEEPKVDAPPPVPVPVPPPRPPVVVVVTQPTRIAFIEDDPCKHGSTVPAAIDFAPFVGMSTAFRARDVRTISIGAIGATAHGIRGVEVSGVVGVDRCTVSGAQIAGVAAITKTVHGVQIGGVTSVAETVEGAQISGTVNVAGGDVNGAQIGVVNISGGRVKGPQIGVVNIAAESDAPIGIVNVMKRGRHHVDVWSNETGMTMAGLQLGGTYTHAILGIGARPGPDTVRFVYGAGIGVHVPIASTFSIDVDVMHHDLAAFLATPKLVQQTQARAIVCWEIVPRLAIYGGPTFNVLVSNDRRDSDPSPYSSFRLGSGEGDISTRAWPGLTLGARML